MKSFMWIRQYLLKAHLILSWNFKIEDFILLDL